MSGADVMRRAATLVAARPGPKAGVEVLVLRRSDRSRFLPGYVVFPGGAVDPEDEALAVAWFGSGSRPEQVARAAAIRELIEETGLAVTSRGLEAARGGSDVAALRAVTLDPPAPVALRQIAHWVAPEDVPVRFDARYFAVDAPRGVEPVPDAVEAAAAWWADPRELLERWAADGEKLYWPTMKTVQALAACEDVGALLALDIPQHEPEPGDEERMPRSTFYQSDAEFEQARRASVEGR
ncbi:MAG: NUDIX domain-containing protein [Actinomycetota bacterium]